MTNDLSKRVADLLALEAAATPGPWRSEADLSGFMDVRADDSKIIAECGCGSDANADLIAVARNIARELAEAWMRQRELLIDVSSAHLFAKDVKTMDDADRRGVAAMSLDEMAQELRVCAWHKLSPHTLRAVLDQRDRLKELLRRCRDIFGEGGPKRICEDIDAELAK